MNKDNKDFIIEGLVYLLKSKEEDIEQLKRKLQLVEKQEKTILSRPESTSDYNIKKLENEENSQSEKTWNSETACGEPFGINKLISNNLYNKPQRKKDWRKSGWLSREEVLKFFKPSNKKNHSICLQCNGTYQNGKLSHHYHRHSNDKVRQKEKDEKLVEKTNTPTEWHNKKYVFDKQNNKYRCLICAKLFKFFGTGTHWWSHLQRGETTLPSKSNYL